MKTLTKIVFLAALVLCGVSCSSGDDDAATPSNPDTPQPEYPTFDTPRWETEVADVVTKYDNNMTVYFVLPESLRSAASSADKVSVYCGAECRGVAYLEPLSADKSVWMGMVYGKDGDALTVRYYSGSTKHLYKSTSTIQFAGDTMYGNVDEPKTLDLEIVTIK